MCMATVHVEFTMRIAATQTAAHRIGNMEAVSITRSFSFLQLRLASMEYAGELGMWLVEGCVSIFMVCSLVR